MGRYGVLCCLVAVLCTARLISAQQCATNAYAGPAVSIPDNDETGVYVAVAVPQAMTIGSVSIRFTIEHPFDWDLGILLVHPNGEAAAIVADAQESSEFGYINVKVDDFAPTQDYSTRFKPFTSFAEAFGGLSSAGAWLLYVGDFAERDSGQVVAFEITVCDGPPSCTGICGDPHFSGLDGVKYQFAGLPDKVFALVSDPTTELNGKFVTVGGHKTTYLGETCLRICNDTLVVRPPHYVTLNGRAMAIGSRHEAARLLVERKHKHSVEVTVANRWIYRFNVGEHVDVAFVEPLYTYDNKTHGVLGHTLKHRDAGVPAKKCNAAKEGGCEVEGDFHDYMVRGDDLCSVDWPMSQFDADMCM